MKKILIVDDVTINHRLVKAVLQDKYEVMTAKSGVHALEIMQTDLPDLVLLDISMPGMNGYELMEEMRNQEKIAGIPVIFLTADTDTTAEIRGLKMGAVDYIRKPFEPEILIYRIERALGGIS